MTKLTPEQKIARKELKAFFNADGWELHSFPEFNATVAIRRTGSCMGEFTVAIASKDEPKFKRKVGEYFALRRLDEGVILPFTMSTEFADWEHAEMLAYGLGWTNE